MEIRNISFLEMELPVRAGTRGFLLKAGCAQVGSSNRRYPG